MCIPRMVDVLQQKGQGQKVLNGDGGQIGGMSEASQRPPSPTHIPILAQAARGGEKAASTWFLDPAGCLEPRVRR